ncbi:hypothetical protein [Acinetobacter bohemicus]|uniref:hypothetical protein n=1 Tax=Acinetobacter bohemicus TaxID=1435036 RepID=UPI004040F1FA
MGGSSGQVTGYRYFTNLLLFIGNPIEKMLGINFDKRGWVSPFVDENGNALAQGTINSPSLYGENEGGIAGTIHVQYGRDNQEVLPFYKSYMESKDLPASAFPYQSYLAFTGLGVVNNTGLIGGVVGALMPYRNNAFYVGNSGYMKEMLLWPKRIHVRNDGREQWYDLKAEIPDSELSEHVVIPIYQGSDNLFNSWQFYLSYGGNEYSHSYNNLEINYSKGILNYNGNNNYAHNGIYGDVGHLDALSKLEYIFDLGDLQGVFKIRTVVEISGTEKKVKYDTNAEVLSVSAISRETKTDDQGVYYDEIITDYVLMVGGDGFFKSLLSASRVAHGFSVYANIRLTMEPMEWIIQNDILSGDINPIHKIREILTDDTAMNKPESSVDNINFTKAANRIYDEGLGISWSITEKSCIDAINELCYHIEAGIRVNRQTGLYEMVLFRDDWFDENEIHTIPENKIKKDSMQYEITNADEVINQVNVNFYDRANIKNSSFSISESGLIQTLGRVNAETVDFPYFMNMRNAEIVANWKLKLLSTGVYKGTFTTGWREARKWNRYDLIRLPWSRRWSETILVRIMSINLGGPTNNEVSIDFIEVVPSTGMMNTTIVADDVIDKPLQPQACEYEPFEMPYYLAAMRLGQRQVDEELAYDSNFGLVGVVAEKPQENSLYAVMMTNNYDEWVRAGSIQYSLTADSDQIISKTSSSFTVKNWKKISNVPVGTLIQCGKEWLTGLSEWMVFQGVNSNTGVVSVKRGALDTQPQEWDSNLKLYFCGNDVAYDETEYVSGEEVLVSALTTTPSGVLEQKGSNQVEMKARAIRPYPPANVKINGDYWPKYIDGGFVLTWVNRNRLQQTGGEIIGYFDDGVMLESNTQTLLTVTEFDENHVELSTQNANVTAINTFILSETSMSIGVREIEIVLKTMRGGFECMRPFKHTVLTSTLSAPGNVTFEVIEL